MALVESYRPPAELTALQKQRDEIAERAADIAIKLATAIMQKMAKRHKRRFQLIDGMGSTFIDIKPSMEDVKTERVFDRVSSFDIDSELSETDDPEILAMLQGCKQVFELSDYLNETFRYELGGIDV